MAARRRRLILVDDHEAFRESMCAWLDHEGYDVVGATHDGVDGVRLCADTHADLVLLDLHLPGRSGVDVAAELALLAPAPQVILISSDASAVDDPLVQAAPVAGFLAKRELTCDAIDALLS